ncbi:MAG: AAA family ATPase [Burkholderiales bacterium]|nr:AAA family ATPase [Burkholderiales bacterium]
MKHDPTQQLADGFAAHIERWAVAGHAAQAAEIARQLSLATSRGDVCVTVDAAVRDKLLASGVAGTPELPRSFPLVVDGEGRVYLHRYFDYEVRLARRLTAAKAQPGGLRVISGGPGTGKTTMVVKLLEQMFSEQPDTRVALAAPTGKAAARMTEAIHREASTIHRLLRYHPKGGFAHHRDNPLAIDLLVVDEASMLDLALATHLLEAVPPTARVVLLGDKDQLAAVESGAVFAELSSMPDVATWLTTSYRFAADSGIGRLARDINAGDAETAIGWLRGAEGEVVWRDTANPAQGYAVYFEAVQRDPRDVAAVHAAFSRFRVLCATRSGPQGVEAINEALEPQRTRWYAGRPVMVTVNDYTLKLFNGDIGIALPDEQGDLLVWFPDGTGGWRATAPARMPLHETAFAMTVHKSQGSEFDDVLVLLPRHASAVLTRELLYTAVTRARKHVTLVATEEALRGAIEHKVERASGLLARL